METVRFLGPDTDAYVASVVKHADEFTEQTGIGLETTIVASDDYFAGNIQGALAEPGRVDVFMSGPVLLWEHMGAGLVAPLDAHVASASAQWDADDFFGTLLKSNRWTGRFGDPLGHGPLMEVPVNCESYNLAYVPEHLQAAGVGVPTTWDEYFAAAAAVAQRVPGTMGFAQRGTEAWHTMYTGFATYLWSQGGSDFDGERVAVASDEALPATTRFVDALREAGPTDWTSRRWYELALDFGAGKYGLIVDSDHYAPIFENPELCSMGERIAYAMTPAGTLGVRPNLWTWSLAMTESSRHPELAWAFIEWASSKEFLLRSASEGNLNPTRRSVWEAPQFKELVSGWGDFAAVSRKLLEHHAEVLVTPHPRYRTIAERWVQALREAYTGDDVAAALRRAAADMGKIAKG
ncbi:extracellular solute-binding protein [Tessaracoccus sp. OS52]|uniref:ABC transporter substrate-binding protein n=1 Tax=Tessaracoccus sp. OS52 TaxID=2886691 RepID=UPI001D125644|nr:extracellular solute-binding protein [Tessaracoccus sp. OS52]MCC2593843.1 extracellular solute-binding protein [Tessaracoccus sp. OS52]